MNLQLPFAIRAEGSLFFLSGAGYIEGVAFVREIVIPICAFPAQNRFCWACEGEGDFVFAVDVFRAEAPRADAFAFHVVGYGVSPAADVSDVAADV